MIERTIKPERMNPQGAISDSESKPYYPTISLNLKNIPEAKKWHIGEDYCVELMLRQVGKYENKDGGTATFEIRKICLADEEGSDLEEAGESDEYENSEKDY